MTEVSSGVYHAIPLDLRSPTKLEYILDRLVEHENEWSDHQKGRRDIATAILAEHYSGMPTFIFEVLLLGITIGESWSVMASCCEEVSPDAA